MDQLTNAAAALSERMPVIEQSQIDELPRGSRDPPLLPELKSDVLVG